jgi:hypothetical protein
MSSAAGSGGGHCHPAQILFPPHFHGQNLATFSSRHFGADPSRHFGATFSPPLFF